MHDKVSTKEQVFEAIKAIRSIYGLTTTEAEADATWDKLILSEKEKLMKEYERLKKNIH